MKFKIGIILILVTLLVMPMMVGAVEVVPAPTPQPLPPTTMPIDTPKYGPTAQELPYGWTIRKAEMYTQDGLDNFQEEYGMRPVYIEEVEIIPTTNHYIIFEFSSVTDARAFFSLMRTDVGSDLTYELTYEFGDECIVIPPQGVQEGGVIFRNDNFVVLVYGNTEPRTLTEIVDEKLERFILPMPFAISNLVINPAKVAIGKPVTIAVDVTNTGYLEDTYKAILRIDEGEVEAKDVTVAPGATETVTFSPVTKDAVGIYNVAVGDQVETFRVLKSAAFTVRNLVISPVEVETGKPVKIAVDVMNTGETKDVYTVILNINGAEVETIAVTVAPEATETVSFVIIKDEVGTYSVDVNDQTGTFTVTEQKPGLPGFEAVFAITGLLVVAYLIRRRE